MRKKEIYHYYVEGDDEKHLLDALKREIGCIQPGKVEKFNVIQQRITIARIRPLKQDTIVVFVYDTDVESNLEILSQNAAFLHKQKGIRDLICIPQVRNLEEELVRCCDISNVGELTKSSTKTDYKRALISCTNLGARLKMCGFDVSKLWSQIPANGFQKFGNGAEKIKL